MTAKRVVPLEAEEQATLFEWAGMQRGKWPELDRMYHIPNGGQRKKSEAARMKAEGVKRGVPDVHLPLPVGKYHGLYVEMKRQKGGKVEPEQRDWIDWLNAHGYKAVICKGWKDAAEEITAYLEGR